MAGKFGLFDVDARKVFSKFVFYIASGSVILAALASLTPSDLQKLPRFVAALAGLGAWQLSGNAIVGIWFAVFADLMAYIPAFIKTWRHPHTEGHWFYTLSAIGVTLSMVAYPLSAASAFQIYLILSSLVMIFCIYHRQIFPAEV